MSDERTVYERANDAFERHVYDGGGGAWAQLQRTLADWQMRNFGMVPVASTALGVAEELGELAHALVGMTQCAGRLCHAVLKAEQQIRGYDDESRLRAEACDAIGDLTIYAMQVCSRLRIDYEEAVFKTAEQVMKRDWRAAPKDGGAR